MTIIAAWRSDEGIVILSDTGVTDNTDTRKEPSSFGQHYQTDNGDFIHEALLKICVFQDKIVLGYASNDVDNAIEIIELFKDQLENDVPVKDALKKAIISGAPNESCRSAAFIVAYVGKAGPVLLHADTNNGVWPEERAYIQIGSLPSTYSQLTKALESELESRDLKIHGRLLALSALMHEVACHENLTKFNVSGTFVGVVLDRERVLWQPDMAYVLFEEDGEIVTTGEIIWVACRDGGVIVKSNWPSHFKILLNSFNTNDYSEWDNKWGTRLNGQMPLGMPLRWVFINKKRRKVLLLEKRANTNNYHLDVELDGGDKAHIRLSDQLNQALLRRPHGESGTHLGPSVEFFVD